MQKEEIVVSTVGSNPDVKNSAVGQVGVVPEYLGESLLNQNTVVFTSKFSTSIQNRFLFYVLISTPYRDHLDLHAHGTANQASLNITDMLSFQIALPSIEEQRSIARFLDHKTAQIDALIAKKETLLKKLAEKRTALISQAVTKGCDRAVPMKDSGIEWLGEIPAHWNSGALKRVAKRVVVGIAEAATHAYADEGIPILRSTNIRPSRIIGDILKVDPDYSDGRGSKLIRSGDLVTVRTGNAGVTALVPPELDGCQCFTMLITTLIDTVEPKFYCYFINSKSAESYFGLEGWGTAQINISVPILKELPITIPSYSEQENIVDFLDRETEEIDVLVAKVNFAIDRFKEYRTALITNAVTGKIDVRDVILELEPVEAA